MSPRLSMLASVAALGLMPSIAEAAVWGSFDSTRVNYGDGVLPSGGAYVQVRALLMANGDTLAPTTGTLDAAYLSGIDVFYTSLLSNSSPVLSAAEQTALTNWVAAGGTLVVTGDIFPLPFYESFTQPFGVTGWTETGAGTATPTGMHPVTAGVANIDQVTQSTFVFGADALEIATANDGNPFIIVLEPGTGFCSGGRVLITGDHNMFTDSYIGNADNATLMLNVVTWASSPVGGCGVCGNGVLEPGEGCDDSNLIDTDDCPSNCQPATCGDGYVWAGMEDCDDANMDDTDACISNCTDAACGDGFVWAGMEACDDGNGDDTDACPSTCMDAICGDGYVWAGMETCDDGNGDDTDACPGTCMDAICGDGYVWAGMETCDDANGDNGDDCPVTCQMATCGDGYVWFGVEECDDGNISDDDECPSTCVPAECGDGYVWAGMEECDDGNEVDDDECANDCTSNVAGSTGDPTTGSVDDTGDTGTDGTGGDSGVVDGSTGGTTGGEPGDGTALVTTDATFGRIDEPTGCACSSGERTGSGAWGLWGLLLLVRRRRRAA